MLDELGIRKGSGGRGTAPLTKGEQRTDSQLDSVRQESEPGKTGTTSSFQVPSLSLPKGGGALKAIDEKFSVNAVNGTGALSVPLPFSHTRSGLDGGCSLDYNSGAGNGIFGLGWSLSLPSIQRRTDKGLPRYKDDLESDVFVLAGAEDLVPAYRQSETGAWEREMEQLGPATAQRYRPRVEGGFARIQRITVDGESGCYWKVTTPDNVVTLYGRTTAARIASPDDPDHVFRWLPEWRWDDKGNCVEFIWKAEDLAQVPDSMEEANRHAGIALFTNRYLKQIRYGNKRSYYPDPAHPFDPEPPKDPAYLFEAVFDYGEHDDAALSPEETAAWPCRLDPFSDYRPGFEVRTYRLCRRVLFFHSFSELATTTEGEPKPCLVRSLDFSYRFFQFESASQTRSEVDLLASVKLTHYRLSATGGYDRKSLPAMEFTYQEPMWDSTIQTIAPADLSDAPAGGNPPYQWMDLYGEGLPGLIAEESGAWYYKSNLGNGHFAPASVRMEKPSFAGVSTGVLTLEDLDADGSKQLVSRSPHENGFFELDDDGHWEPFRAFPAPLHLNLSDPNVRLLDLDGDGRSDLLLTEESAFRWWPSLGRQGFSTSSTAPKAIDEERGPKLVFAEPLQTIFLADMTGDGLTDLVRIRNGEVCYWPNLGFGRFGPKVATRDAPVFDTPDLFLPSKVRLADITGTGAADLIYLGANCRMWVNLAGNAWSSSQSFEGFPVTAAEDHVTLFDLLGNGTSCLVWSSPLPAAALLPVRYVDPMAGQKPYLLRKYQNNLGKEVTLDYRSSTEFYLADKQAGHPWATKLPFPVHCVNRTETRDVVAGTRFAREYRYRHGCYDHTEREFRGFGLVEQRDTEDFERFVAGQSSNVVDATLHQAPVRTRHWSHTGVYLDGHAILSQFASDYYQNPIAAEPSLPDARIESEATLSTEELRQAVRACKSAPLREEVFADDNSPSSSQPYSTAQHSCVIRMLQPQLGNRYAVFLVHEAESLTLHYERNPADPRIAHTLNTVVDDLGHVLESTAVVYGRTSADPALPSEVTTAQQAVRITYAVHRYTGDILSDAVYRLRAPCESQTFELTGCLPAGNLFQVDEIRSLFGTATSIAYEQEPSGQALQKRLLSHERTLYVDDADLTTPLPLGTLGSLGLPHADYHLALTPTLLNSLYGDKASTTMLTEGGYTTGDGMRAQGLFPATDGDGLWWAGSGTVLYPSEPNNSFYLPDRYMDPFGAVTRVRYYGDSYLIVDQTEDALGNRTTAERINFRLLQPEAIRDINQNLSEGSFDLLGLVVGTALRGKGDEADDLDGFQPDLTDAEITAFLADLVSHGADLLQHATSRFVYSFAAVPAVAASIVRETHYQEEVAAGTPSKLQYAFAYSNGLGQVAMQKVQAEPGIAKQCDLNADGTYKVVEVDTTPNLRWIGTGRTVVNNKGNPVLQYEPYFSTTHSYEDAAELVCSGVTPVLQYDAPGRLIRTDFPDGAFSTVGFSPWQQSSSDRNDNVLASTWYTARIAGALGPLEQDAANKAAVHDTTPSIAHLNSLGQKVYAVAHNRYIDRATGSPHDEFFATYTHTDIQGRSRRIVDARGNTVMTYAYDLLGRTAHTLSMDAGERWSLPDVLGQPLYNWDGKGNRFRTNYDLLRRPTTHEVLTAGAINLVLSRTEYGTDPDTNQNGRVLRQWDGSGLLQNSEYDFKGNLLDTRRTFTVDYTTQPNWSQPDTVELQETAFETTSTFDALNRVVETVTPDASRTKPEYGPSGSLVRLSVALQGSSPQLFVTHVDHNEKGQRLEVSYGNGTITKYTYDPLTFRLERILTIRTSDLSSVQDLNYTFDPIGNITHIADQAQQTLFFNNQVVSPDNDFTYDATYRLIVATGRESIGQNAPPGPFDETRTNLPHPMDGRAMRNYLQRYEYDAANNMIAMRHQAGIGSLANAWVRTFQIERFSNRLVASQVTGTEERFSYDAHGSIVEIPHLPSLAWSLEDYLLQTELGGGGIAYYTYDSNGMRSRKAIVRSNNLIEERIYLGTFETFKRVHGSTVELQRETLHIMDGEQRLVQVDTRVKGNDASLIQLDRYQYSNNTGNASLELNEKGMALSYEEYYPFGSTSANLQADQLPSKRYRYTSKERDEETGLYFYGARYYPPWLGRWISVDPSAHLNRYQFVSSNPINVFDPDGKDGIWAGAKDWARQAIASPASQVAIGAGAQIGEYVGEAAKNIDFPGRPILLTAASMIDAFNAEPTVAEGVLMAANQLNPLYHGAISGHNFLEAVEQQKYQVAGAEAVNVIASLGAVVGFGRGIAKGVSHASAKANNAEVVHIGASARQPFHPPNPINDTGSNVNCVPGVAAFAASYHNEPIVPQRAGLTEVPPGRLSGPYITATEVEALAGRVGADKTREAITFQGHSDAATYVERALKRLADEGRLRGVTADQISLETFAVDIPRGVAPELRTPTSDLSFLPEGSYLVTFKRGTNDGHAIFGRVGSPNSLLRSQPRMFFDPQTWKSHVPDPKISYSFSRIKGF